MRVLIGCEYTGIGQKAFSDAGHDAWSCDLDPTEGDPDKHLQMDIFEAIRSRKWDQIILHPECTRMALCGNGTYAPKGVMSQGRKDDIEWTVSLWDEATSVCDRVALENPGSVIFPILRNKGAKVQYIQPWQFGHPETKKTGFALHNLPPLKETNNVYEYMMTLPLKERHKVWYMGKSDTRGKDRARSYPGIYAAIAKQWGVT